MTRRRSSPAVPAWTPSNRTPTTRSNCSNRLEEQKGKADFAAVVANAKLTMQDTPEFEEGQTAGLPEASIPGFVEAAFKLTPQDP